MYETSRTQELYHHGVKGMKWGVRKKRDDAVSQKRAVYKQAKKDYNKSFNKAYNRAAAAYSPFKKHRQANDARWEDAANKAEALRKAKGDYKQAKKDQYTPEERKARAKKAVKIGAAVAGTALAAYGAYKVPKLMKDKAFNKAYKRAETVAMDQYESLVRNKIRARSAGNTSAVRSLDAAADKLLDRVEGVSSSYAKARSGSIIDAAKELVGRKFEMDVSMFFD